MSELIGKQHQALLEKLATNWLQHDGTPICLLEGFSGTGKSSVARELMTYAGKQDIPSVLIEVSEAPRLTDSLFMPLVTELSDVGYEEMAQAVNQGDKELPRALSFLMRQRLLIVIDEAQRAFAKNTGGKFVKALEQVLTKIANHPSSPGRILLVSNQSFADGSWRDAHRLERLQLLEPDEAIQLLRNLLETKGIRDSIADDRQLDVVKWLGCNPSAIRRLVAALERCTLDELIGLKPKAWESRNREVDPVLIESLEAEILRKTLDRLEERARELLCCLSIFRQPFAQSAIKRFCGPEVLAERIDEMRGCFILERFPNSTYFSLNALARNVVFQRLKQDHSTEQIAKIHDIAAEQYTRHFTAQQTVQGFGALAGYFVEAKYHLTQSGNSEALDSIAQSGWEHIRNSINPNASPVPQDQEELDEEIALIQSLLRTRELKSFNYYLARLLKSRSRAGDLPLALDHISRAVGKHAPLQTWLLKIELERLVNGARVAIEAAKTGIGHIPADKNLFSLYDKCGSLLASEGRGAEAIDLLKEGIERIPADKGLVALYDKCGSLLASEGRGAEAIDLLKEGIERIPADKGLVALYDKYGSLLASEGRGAEAIDLLKEGIERIPTDKNVFSLYERCGSLLASEGRGAEAIDFLKEGIERIPADKGLVVLYERCGSLFASEGRGGEAIDFLKEGIERIPADKGLFALFSSFSRINQQLGQLQETVQVSFKFLRKNQVFRSRYKVFEYLIFNCLGCQDIKTLEDITGGTLPISDATGITLAQSAILQLQDRYQEAANIMKAHRERNRTYLVLYSQEAFLRLCCCEPHVANSIWDDYPAEIRLDEKNSLVWLKALISIKLGDAEFASKLLHLDTELSDPSRPILELLWEIWYESYRSQDWHGVALYYPTLPPKLTGLPHPITHPFTDSLETQKQLKKSVAKLTRTKRTKTMSENQNNSQEEQQTPAAQISIAAQIIAFLSKQKVSALFVIVAISVVGFFYYKPNQETESSTPITTPTSLQSEQSSPEEDTFVDVEFSVIDQQGVPLNLVDVTFSYDGGSETLTTNTQGKVRKPMPLGRNVTVEIFHEGYAQLSRDITQEREGKRNRRLVLQKAL